MWKKRLVCPLDEEMTDKRIEGFLFLEKSLGKSGRQPLNFDYIYEKLAKPNVTLSLLHYEHEKECCAKGKILYSYRSFLRHYSKYAASLRVRRKPIVRAYNIGYTSISSLSVTNNYSLKSEINVANTNRLIDRKP